MSAFSIGRLARIKQTSIGRHKVFLHKNPPEANMSDIHDTIPGVFDVKNPSQVNMSTIHATIPGVITISSGTPVSICSTVSQTGQDKPDQRNNKMKSRKSSLFESLTKHDSEKNLVFLKASNEKDINLLRCLMFKVPWSSGYRKVTKAWENAEKILSEQKGRDSNLIFNIPISAKSIKDHFKVLLK